MIFSSFKSCMLRLRGRGPFSKTSIHSARVRVGRSVVEEEEGEEQDESASLDDDVTEIVEACTVLSEEEGKYVSDEARLGDGLLRGWKRRSQG
jgi:hypothetical protein